MSINHKMNEKFFLQLSFQRIFLFKLISFFNNKKKNGVEVTTKAVINWHYTVFYKQTIIKLYSSYTVLKQLRVLNSKQVFYFGGEDNKCFLHRKWLCPCALYLSPKHGIRINKSLVLLHLLENNPSHE